MLAGTLKRHGFLIALGRLIHLVTAVLKRLSQKCIRNKKNCILTAQQVYGIVHNASNDVQALNQVSKRWVTNKIPVHHASNHMQCLCVVASCHCCVVVVVSPLSYRCRCVAVVTSLPSHHHYRVAAVTSPLSRRCYHVAIVASPSLLSRRCRRVVVVASLHPRCRALSLRCCHVTVLLHCNVVDF